MQSQCPNIYDVGFADGRRTVEAELAAERHALATLAIALGDAIAGATLHLSPADAARLDPLAIEICAVADTRLQPGDIGMTGHPA